MFRRETFLLWLLSHTSSLLLLYRMFDEQPTTTFSRQPIIVVCSLVHFYTKIVRFTQICHINVGLAQYVLNKKLDHFLKFVF